VRELLTVLPLVEEFGAAACGLSSAELQTWKIGLFYEIYEVRQFKLTKPTILRNENENYLTKTRQEDQLLL